MKRKNTDPPKIIFRSKKQREEDNKKKLEEEEKFEQKKIEKERWYIDKFLSSSSHRDREKSHRDRNNDKFSKYSRKEKENESNTNLSSKELDLIKEHYLVKRKTEKRIIPVTSAQRFAMSWPTSEDTTQMDISENIKKIEFMPSFGRGGMAGYDRREQRKKYENIKEKVKAKEVSLKEKPLNDMTERDWRIFLEDYDISVRGGRIIKPLRSWKESNIPKALLDSIIKLGYKEPTPIQRQSIPIGLKNRDLIGIAQTGSGKTLAFLIPLFAYISTLPKLTQDTALDGPYSVILVPTRELANQIHEEASKFYTSTKIRCVVLVGGVSIDQQAIKLREGCEIVIATPGRLNDILERRFIVLNQCNYVVLDEADRMIDMGFEPQVISILDAMPSSNLRPENIELEDSKRVYRQTFMFSATMPTMVEKLAKKYLRNPMFVAIGDRSINVVKEIEQTIEMTTCAKKKSLLFSILRNSKPPIMIFCNIKGQCDALSYELEAKSYKCGVIHGGKVQSQRENALSLFKQGSSDIILCTDVLGRGIDIPNVSLVINYDMPKNIEQYTHRIGRTGRIGKRGQAVSFVTPEDEDIYYDLKHYLTMSGSSIPAELARHEASSIKPGDFEKKKRKDKIIYAK